MKKHLIYIMSICLVALLVACSGDNESAVSLSVDPAQLTLPANGSAVNFTVNTPVEWAVVKSTNTEWLSINPARGAGATIITVSALENTSTSQRTGTISVTATGGLKHEITVTQSGRAMTLPAEAGAISGASTNVCPVSISVELTAATITGATSYQWYRNGTTVAVTNEPVYEATESGAYTIAGVNLMGVGTPGIEKRITITQCPLPVAAGEIAGTSENMCPLKNVELSIQPVANAVSYQWYKNGEAIGGATSASYVVTETGSYTVAGVNASGAGVPSSTKIVSIVSCEMFMKVSDLVGTWEVTEELNPVNSTTGVKNYEVTITLGTEQGEDESVIFINGLALMTSGVKIAKLGATVEIVAINTGKLHIPAQFINSWNTQYAKTLFAALIGSNQLTSAPPAAIERNENGDITITFASDDTPSPGGTYRVVALDEDNKFQATFTIRNKTVMKKIASSTQQ